MTTCIDCGAEVIYDNESFSMIEAALGREVS